MNARKFSWDPNFGTKIWVVRIKSSQFEPPARIGLNENPFFVRIFNSVLNSNCRILRLVSKPMIKNVDIFLVSNETVLVTTEGKPCSFVVTKSPARKSEHSRFFPDNSIFWMVRPISISTTYLCTSKGISGDNPIPKA